MAPEQLSGEGADARSDLFSLGVILYSMLTGFRPFQGNSAATVVFKVVNRDPLPVTSFDSSFPAALDRLVSKAIAKDPAQRYQTGAEMAQDIQRLRLRHELMNQTAQSLESVANPGENTGIVRIARAPSVTATPAPLPSPIPSSAKSATASTTGFRTISPSPVTTPQSSAPAVVIPPIASSHGSSPAGSSQGSAKAVTAAKPIAPPPLVSRKPTVSLKSIAKRMPQMPQIPGLAAIWPATIPKEIAFVAAAVLFLAISFISYEIVHVRRARTAAAKTNVPSAVSATTAGSSDPNSEAAKLAALDRAVQEGEQGDDATQAAAAEESEKQAAKQKAEDIARKKGCTAAEKEDVDPGNSGDSEFAKCEGNTSATGSHGFFTNPD